MAFHCSLAGTKYPLALKKGHLGSKACFIGGFLSRGGSLKAVMRGIARDEWLDICYSS